MHFVPPNGNFWSEKGDRTFFYAPILTQSYVFCNFVHGRENVLQMHNIEVLLGEKKEARTILWIQREEVLFEFKIN